MRLDVGLVVVSSVLLWGWCRGFVFVVNNAPTFSLNLRKISGVVSGCANGHGTETHVKFGFEEQ